MSNKEAYEAAVHELKARASDLSLVKFRKELSDLQIKYAEHLGEWFPITSKKLEKELITADQEDPVGVGFFACEPDWDEPYSFPEFSPKLRIIPGFPKLESAQKMSFRNCSPEDLILHKKYSVLEAPEDALEFVPQFVFTPALVADKKGSRIGRGAGFYDRYFQENPQCKRIGVLHSLYLFEELPAHWLHAGDMALNHILTENKEFIL